MSFHKKILAVTFLLLFASPAVVWAAQECNGFLSCATFAQNSARQQGGCTIQGRCPDSAGDYANPYNKKKEKRSRCNGASDIACEEADMGTYCHYDTSCHKDV